MQVGPMPIDFTNFIQFHPISNFTISPYFGIIFTCFHHFRKFSLNVGKETTAFEPGKKIARKVHVRLISSTRT